MPENEQNGRQFLDVTVSLRMQSDRLKTVDRAARQNEQSRSEWIRDTIIRRARAEVGEGTAA